MAIPYLPIKVEKYKCFSGSEPIGIEGLKQKNIIIGKNNAGKTTLLELIKTVLGKNKKQMPVERVLSKIKTRTVMDIVGSIRHANKMTSPGFDNMVSNLDENSWIDFIIRRDDGRIIPSFENCIYKNGNSISHDVAQKSLEADFSNVIRRCFYDSYNSIYMKPIRNVMASDRANAQHELRISDTGSNITKIFYDAWNDNDKMDDVRVIVRDSLNDILYPELKVEEVRVPQTSPVSLSYEIVIKTKNRSIRLSEMGHGMHTIMSIITLMRIVPEYYWDVNEFSSSLGCLFAIEEPENNIHPMTLRRLVDWMFDTVRGSKHILCLTTHSSIIADMASTDEDCQIIHVKNVDGISNVTRVDSYMKRNHLIDDLGNRASDILQSNGVLWLEGPSDRTYFNFWINIATDGELKEGRHYQCLLYGGSNLAHYSMDDDIVNDLISLLKANRNSMVVMDSDLDGVTQPAGKKWETKQRIINEAATTGAVTFLTEGREIENYITDDIIHSISNGNIPSIGQFDDLEAKYDQIPAGQGKTFDKNKIAKKYVDIAESKELSELWRYDLASKVVAIVAKICEWNGLEPKAFLPPELHELLPS